MIFKTSPTVIESGRVVLAPTPSVTRTVKLVVPAADGVPPITPVLALMLRPAGSVPTEMDQVEVPVPPDETTAWV